MTTNMPRPWYHFSMRARVIAALLVCVVLAGRIIYQNTATSVSDPERLILYSLEYHEEYMDGIPPADETFQGIPVLGKVDVNDVVERKRIITALNTSKAEGESVAKCFYPRHGVRVIEGGREIDHLICFECHWLQIYLNGVLKSNHVPISRHAQPVFNRVLDEAKVPIMPEARGKVDDGK